MSSKNEQPWLENKDWRDNKILSNAKFGMYFLFGFAVVWNLISFPILFTADDLLSQIEREPITAMVFLFPVIGVVLVGCAINAFNNWRKFGATPLVMDPFPGSISGHVGGIIENRIRFHSNNKYEVSLSCHYSYMSGSGKDRKRTEKVVWQTEGVCFSEPTIEGTKVSYRFTIPDDLPESEEKNASSYHLWRVTIKCKLPGTDYDRQFEIPVYNGQRFSERLARGTEDNPQTVQMAEDGLYETAQIEPIAGGLNIYYPMLTRPAGGIMATLFGMIFGGVGIAMLYVDDVPIIFPLSFTPIGLFILCIGIWELGKSLQSAKKSQLEYTEKKTALYSEVFQRN